MRDLSEQVGALLILSVPEVLPLEGVCLPPWLHGGGADSKNCFVSLASVNL